MADLELFVPFCFFFLDFGCFVDWGLRPRSDLFVQR